MNSIGRFTDIIFAKQLENDLLDTEKKLSQVELAFGEQLKNIKKSFLESMQQGYVDEYQAWCFQHLECFCSETIDNAWNETLGVAFSDFIKWSGKEVVDA